MKAAVVLGIDPGYDRLGWAVGTVEKRSIIEAKLGVFQTSKSDSYFKRFTQLHTQVSELVAQYQPDILAMETLVAAKNAPTVVAVAQVRGMVLSICLQAGMEVREVGPSQVKLAVTGSGRATKQEVAKMVQLLTKVQVSGVLDDAVDALAIALTGAVMG